jgi:HPt (histidine-containing phosphotransfer) domain-containing protein
VPLSFVCDLHAALDALEGDRELLFRMIEAFLDETPTLLEESREAIVRRDAHALERSAHTIRGGLSNFAANGAYAAATRLENTGRDGNWTDAAMVHAQLESEMKDVLEVLAGFDRGGAL